MGATSTLGANARIAALGCLVLILAAQAYSVLAIAGPTEILLLQGFFSACALALVYIGVPRIRIVFGLYYLIAGTYAIQSLPAIVEMPLAPAFFGFVVVISSVAVGVLLFLPQVGKAMLALRENENIAAARSRLGIYFALFCVLLYYTAKDILELTK
jgi:hypothetical protein